MAEAGSLKIYNWSKDTWHLSPAAAHITSLSCCSAWIANNFFIFSSLSWWVPPGRFFDPCSEYITQGCHQDAWGQAQEKFKMRKLQFSMLLPTTKNQKHTIVEECSIEESFWCFDTQHTHIPHPILVIFWKITWVTLGSTYPLSMHGGHEITSWVVNATAEKRDLFLQEVWFQSLFHGVCIIEFLQEAVKYSWGIRFAVHLPSSFVKTHSHSHRLALPPVSKTMSDITLPRDLVLLCFHQSSNTWTAQAMDLFEGTWLFLASATSSEDDNWKCFCWGIFSLRDKLSFFFFGIGGRQFPSATSMIKRTETARANRKQTQALAIYACTHAIQVGAYVALLS